MRVVLDTNVLLAGILTRGVCEALLDRCLRAPACTIVASEYLLGEFAEHAAGKFGLTAAEVAGAVGFLRRHCEMVEPAVMPEGACDDADDLPVLGTAVAGRADVLVTGDAALVRLGRVNEVPILTPRAFFDAWG